MLKGIIAKQKEQLPPRVHNLMRLAELASLDVPEDRAQFLRELSAYYIQTRYPEEIESAAKGLAPKMAQETLEKTEEIM